MSALMIDGKVVGKWKKKNKKLSVTMFKTVTQQEKNIVDESAHSLWSDVTNIEFE